METINFFFTDKIFCELDNKSLYDDSQGNVDKGKVLKDLTSCFVALSDESMINALKSLQTLYHSKDCIEGSPTSFRVFEEIMMRLGVTGFNSSCDSIEGCVQIARQLLTNAFALKRGTRIEELKLLSLKEADDKAYIAEFFLLMLSIYEDQRQRPLTPDFNLDLLDGAETFRLLSNSQQNFVTSFSWSMANSMASNFDFVGNYSRVLNGMIEGMKRKFQMPPYGISLALDWEDGGQDMLPWLDDIPESKKMEYRQKMHEYVCGMATRVYDAVIAAYCCYLFVDVPQFPQVEKEFSEIKLLKGKFSARKEKLDIAALKTLHRIFEGDESKMDARLRNECSPLYEFFKVLLKIKNNC